MMISTRFRRVSGGLFLTLFFLVFLSRTQLNAQVTVNATIGSTGTSYTTVNAAFTAINAGTHKGVIEVIISANTTEPSTVVPLLKSSTPSSYTSITIKPSGNVTVNGNANVTASRGTIELNGADNVTIDGDDPLTAGTRNLTFLRPTNTGTGLAVIRLSSTSTSGTDGCDNVTIKNCIITGTRSSATSTVTNYGIVMSNSSAITTGAYSSINTIIDNNLITRCYHGIYANGASATYPNTGLIIRNNVIGSATSADNIGFRGIYLSYSAVSTGGALIQNNDIRVGDYGSSGYNLTIAGIEINTVNYGFQIIGNNIHDINQPSTSGYGAHGIYITGSTNNTFSTIASNFIRDCKMVVYQSSATSTFIPTGVFFTAGATNVNFVNNTVVMNAQLGSGTNYSSFCVDASVSGVTFSKFLNNILVNNATSTSAFGFYCSGTGNISGGTVNNNCYYVPGGNVGYYNAANRTTFSAWQSATSKDGASYNLNPTFTSATDLHIPSGTSGVLESGGVATGTSGVTTDIDNQTRPGPAGSINGGATAPDVGADEFDGVPATPCVAPTTQATSLVLTPSSTTCAVSFTAASPTPTGYLVVAALSGNTPTNPVDATTYTVGSTALGANTVVVGVGTGVSYSATGLTANSNYDFYVFDYTSGSCVGGPVYNTNSPLTGSTTTLCPAPVASAATGLGPNGFTANWGSVLGATDYILDVSTNSGFSTFVTGYNGLSVGNVNSSVVSGLTMNTTYYYRVKAGTGCVSGYSSTITVNTPHVVGKTMIEGLATAAFPTGWSNTGFIAGTARGATGNPSNNIYKNLYSSATTGSFTTTNVGPLDANSSLTFEYKITDYSSPYNATAAGWGNFQVQVSTDFGATWTNLGTAVTAAAGTYTVVSNSLASYVGQYVQFKINATWTAGDYDLSFDNFSVLAPCAAPADQATSLVFSGVGPGQMSLTFTAASSGPSGYLVVRYPNGTGTTNPTDGTVYSVGQSLGSGTVVGVGSSLGALASGLTPTTTYDFYIYSYNTNSCVGTVPMYNTSSPLSGSNTTAACATMSTSITVDPTALPVAGSVYNTLTQAMLEINGCGITGPTVIELASTYTSTGETFPIIFGNVSGASVTNTITLRPASSVSSDLVIGGTAANTAIFDFQGAQYFIIDGRPGGTGSFTNRKLVIQNAATAATPSTTASSIRLINGARNNTFQALKINGSSGIGASSGIVFFSTATSAGNSSNTFSNNILDGYYDLTNIANNGFYSAGTVGFENSTNTISTNEIKTTVYAVNINSGSTAWTVTENSVYSTVSINFGSSAGTVIPLWIDAAGTGTGYTITNNKIGTNAANAAGSNVTLTSTGALKFEGIRITTPGATNVLSTVSGNIIKGIGLTTAPAASDLTYVGIRVVGGYVNVGGASASLGNIIGDTTVNGSIVINTSTGTNAYTVHGIRFFGTGTVLSNNAISGINLTSGTGAPTIQLIYDAGASATTRSVYGNLIGSNTVTNSVQILAASTATSPVLSAITTVNSLASTISFNRIRNLSNLSTTSGGSFTGINNSSAGSAGVTITYNTIDGITNASNASTSNTSYTGIISTTTTGSNIISNNTVKNISNLGTATTATVVGISSSTGSNTFDANTVTNLVTSSSSTGVAGSASNIGISSSSTTAGQVISRNTIHTLKTTGSAASNVAAIYYSGPTTGTNEIKNNILHSLYSLTAGGTLHGIDIADAGNTSIYNNMIRLGIDETGASVTSNLVINGINQSGGTSNHTMYFNSIYIGGTGVASGANNTYGIFSGGTTGARVIQNNILMNVRTNGVGTGSHFAISLPATITTLTLDNNDYYTGGTFNTRFNSVVYSSLGDFQTATGKDAVSITIDPAFLNATGNSSTVDLHVTSGVASLLESAGSIVSGITTDIDGEVRPGPVGSVNGGGTAPDIGADEFDGIPAYTCSNPVAGTAIASTNTGCFSLASTTLSLTGSVLDGTGNTYQWESSANGVSYTAIAGANAASYLASSVTQTTYYRCVITCANGPVSATSSVTTITINNPSVVGAVAGSRCGTGTVPLTASLGGNAVSLNWYNSASGGTAFATGTSVTSPTINSTTSFYVEASTLPSTLNGLGNTTIPSSTSATAERGIIISLNRPITIVSSQYYSPTLNVTNTVSVKVVDNSTGVQVGSTLSIPITQGAVAAWYTLPLNITLPAGTYRLLASFSSSVNRHTSGVDYNSPSFNNLGAFGSILSGYDGSAIFTSYNYFHNLTLTSVCVSPRTLVTATVTAPPALTLSAASTSICEGSSTSSPITISSNAADFDTYNWTPSTGVSGNSTSGFTFNSASSTNYTLSATNTSSGCSNTASFSVNVNPRPTLVSTTPSNPSVCSGTVQSLTVSGGTIGAQGTIGTATTLTTATAQPTAFCNRWSQYWMQLVYTAAELQAAGLTAGTINSVAFNITTLGDASNVTNMRVALGTTSNSTLSAWQTTGLTQVYGPSTYNHAIGWNTITFTTPFVWDGVSNILLDVRHDGVDLTNNAQTYYTATSGTTVLTATTSTTSSTSDLASSNPTPSTSINRLNTRFDISSPVSYVWSPSTDLYTDALASAAYTNTNASTLYVKPTSSRTYTITATNPSTGCFRTGDVNVTMLTAPSAPSAPTLSTATSGSLDLSWSSVPNATDYRLDVATDAGFTSFVSGFNNKTISGTTETVGGLSVGTSYYVRVRANNSCGASSNSSTLTTITLSSAPVLSAASAVSATGMTLNWNASTGAASYRLDVATDNAFTSYVSGYQNLTVAGTSQAVTGLTAATRYYYRVRAVNASGTSGNSLVGDTITLSGTVGLTLTAFLEGLYIGSSTMTSAPNNAEAADPSLTGLTSSSVADTLVIQLHHATTFDSLFAWRGPISTLGVALATFPGAVNGNSYYIVVKHRNSLETWSASPVSFGSSASYNFTTAASQAYGDNMVSLGNGKYGIYSGDINQDGAIDASDFTDVDNDNANFAYGYLYTDVNGDGSVDAMDFTNIDNNGSNFISIARP